MSINSDNNFLIDADNETCQSGFERWRNWFFILALLSGLGYFSLKPFIAPWAAGAKVKIEAAVVNNLRVKGSDNSATEKIAAPKLLPKPPIPARKADSADLAGPFTARCVMARDLESGKVLFSKDEYQKWPMASVTKLLSALVLIDLNFDFATTTSAANGEVVDSYVVSGAEYRAEDLWKASLVASSNRAVMSLVRASGLSDEEFVGLMNAKAAELGMLDTVAEDPTGLSPNNITTASDAALLISEAMRDDKIRNTLLIKEINIKDVRGKNALHIWNTDWLLLKWIPNSFKDFRGGKTGYILASGYNFVMQVGDGRGHYISVAVLGADSNESRFSEAKKVAEWVFENFEWPAR